MANHFIIADYDNDAHGEAIVSLLDSYARDPMGGAKPLSNFARENLIDALRNTPGAFSVLGFANDQPVALANCFSSLSTFACLPLINIHDLVVSDSARGQGISQQLLGYIEMHARQQRCCKVTLEVLEGNIVAMSAYEKFGFSGYQLNEESGNAVLLQKLLNS